MLQVSPNKLFLPGVACFDTVEVREQLRLLKKTRCEHRVESFKVLNSDCSTVKIKVF